MEFTINIGGLDSIAAAIDNLAEALKAGAKTSEVIDAARTKSKSKPAAAKVEDPKPSPTATADVSTAEAAPSVASPSDDVAQPSVPAASTATREDIQTACVALSKKSGPGTTKAVIESFGVKFSKDVPDDKLADLLAALTAALEDVDG